MRGIVAAEPAGSKGGRPHMPVLEPPRRSGAGIPQMLWWRPGRTRRGPARSVAQRLKEATHDEEDPGGNGHLGLGRSRGRRGRPSRGTERSRAVGAARPARVIGPRCGGPQEVGRSERLPRRARAPVPGHHRPQLGGVGRPGRAPGGDRRTGAGRDDRARATEGPTDRGGGCATASRTSCSGTRRAP